MNTASDSTGRQFSWNAQDQLTQVQFPTLSALIGYDPLGRRTSLSKGSNSKTFFSLGQSLLSDGSARFLHGAGIDQPLQLDTNLGSQSYLQDHLGSTSQLVDSLNGNSKTRYDYKSYGKLEGDVANSQASNPFTYTGREDDGTGLLYYRARYYDPELEVFISQDPLGDAQRYVSGNPIRIVDPWGLRSLTLYYGPGLPGETYADSHKPANATDDYLSASNPKDLNRVLSQYTYMLAKNNETFTDLHIYSHGNKNLIGEENAFLSISGIPMGFSSLKNKPPLNIRLFACETGQTGGFASELSKYLNTAVTAPVNFYDPSTGKQVLGFHAPNGVVIFFLSPQGSVIYLADGIVMEIEK